MQRVLVIELGCQFGNGIAWFPKSNENLSQRHRTLKRLTKKRHCVWNGFPFRRKAYQDLPWLRSHMEAWKAIVGNLAGFCTPAFYIACRPTIIQFFPEVARSRRQNTDYSSRLEDSHASRQYTREPKRVKTLDSSPNLSIQQLPSRQRTKNTVQTLYNRFIYRSRYLFSFKPSSHFPVIPVEMSERNDLSGHAIFSMVFRLPRFGFSWSSIPWESEICW